MQLHANDLTATLTHFGIHPVTVNGAAKAGGEDVTISGEPGTTGVKSIVVRNASHSIGRMIPLGTGGAELLARQYRGSAHHAAGEHTLRMIEHLLLRVSDLYETPAINHFSLHVRIHDSAYAIIAAEIEARSVPHWPERIGAHAHDGKGGNYRPEPLRR